MLLRELTQDIRLDGLPWFLTQPRAWDCYIDRPWIAFDFETTNLEKGSALVPENRLINVAWLCRGDEDISFGWGDEFSQARFMRDLRKVIEARGFIICHNAKFELQWLHRMGIDIGEIMVYDTMIGDYVMRGNRQWIRLNLGATAKRWGLGDKESVIQAMMDGGVCPSQMPRDLLKARAIKDVRQTVGIYEQQVRKLHFRNQLPLMFSRCIFTTVLADIEKNGMALDRDRVYEEYERAHAEHVIALREFEDFTGGLNPNSPDQMAHYLYGGGVVECDEDDEDAKQYEFKGTKFWAKPNPGKTIRFAELRTERGKPMRNKPSKQFPGGRPKTDAKTLDKLKARTKQQEKFIEMRLLVGKLNAELTKTLQFYKGIVDEYDGEFFGVFNQAVTKTHRTSSNGRKRVIAQFENKEKSVQFQNQPNQFKDLVRPRREGWKQGEVDGSQLEFRAAAFLGDDRTAKEDIRSDVDVHVNSARALYGLDEDAVVTYEQRRLAKPTTFRPIYGGSRGTPGQMAYFAFWKDRYSEMVDTQTGWTEEVLNKKYLTLPWGMRYYWPKTRMSADGYIDNTTQIFNYPIQGFATAEIIPIAVTFLWHRLRANGMESLIVNTVHDSAVGEIAPGEEELWKQLGFYTFTFDVYRYLEEMYGIELDVPLGAGVTIGERWKSPDSEEWELNVERNGECWWKGDRAA